MVALLLVLAIYASHKQHPSHNQKGDGKPSQIAPASSDQPQAPQQTTKSQDEVSWIDRLLDWPNGIGALAVIITLGAIVWQSDETRKSAEAANKGHILTVNQQRPRLLIEPQDFQFITNEHPIIDFKITNIGGSKAIFGLCVTGMEATAPGCFPRFMGKMVFPMKLTNSILDSSQYSIERMPSHPDVTVFPAEVDKSKPYWLHIYGTLFFRDTLFDDVWSREFHYVWNSFGKTVFIPFLYKKTSGAWTPYREEIDIRRKKVSSWVLRWMKIRRVWNAYKAWVEEAENDPPYDQNPN